MSMLDQVLIMAFDWAILAQMKAIEPKLHTAALVSADVWDPQAERALDTLIQQVQALHCEWINMDGELFLLNMPLSAHEHDLRLGVWTANRVDEMRRLVAAGVDSITSDRPDLFTALA